MMPPPGVPRPDAAERDARWSSLARDDARSRPRAPSPNPGRPLVHRLNRAEYANAIRDLLALDVDAAALLPPDDSSAGFDNNADVLGVSPVLLESYLTAAERVSALALGDPEHAAGRRGLPRAAGRVAGPARRGPAARHGRRHADRARRCRSTASISSRSGCSAPTSARCAASSTRTSSRSAVDGERVHLASFGGDKEIAASSDNPTTTGDDVDGRFTVRVPLKAGPHTHRRRVPREDARAQHAAAADLRAQLVRHDRLLGLSAHRRGHPHRPVQRRPARATRRAAAASSCAGPTTRGRRRAVRAAHPVDARRAAPIAATSRRRRPDDAAGLLPPRPRRTAARFDARHRAGAAPHAGQPEVRVPRRARPGGRGAGRAPIALSDLELASRLSFFLWSSIPTTSCSTLAAAGHAAAAGRRSSSRCGGCWPTRRPQALVDNFAGQWLQLRNLQNKRAELARVPGLRRQPAAGAAAPRPSCSSRRSCARTAASST